MSTKTSKQSTKQGGPKPILRAAEFCGSVKKKAVRFCEEFNQILLITPRQILRRSERNKNKAKNDGYEEKSFDLSLLPELDLSPIQTPDLDATSASETDTINESYFAQRALKISSRLKKAVTVNNQRTNATGTQRAYYNQVECEVERRVMATKLFSMSTVYDYMERISLLETELWSDVFQPTKPFLSDINNDTLVLFIQWLKTNALGIFKNNNVTKRNRKAFSICHELDTEKLKKDANVGEPRTTIVYGHTGSGKTQLVLCAARHTGYEVFEVSPSDFRSKDKLEVVVDDVESELADTIARKKKKQNSCMLPLILIDDADVYFDKDIGYMDYLVGLIEKIDLPLVLTVTDLSFAKKLCEKFDESEIQLMTLNYTSNDLVFQVQHFMSTLFFFDVDNEEISGIIEAAGLDIRSTMNILQFFYSPIIMKPLREKDLPDELLELPLPIFETPKAAKDIRYLGEFQFDLYRNGLMKSKLDNDLFVDGIGYIDQIQERKYSALSEFYTEMFNDLATDFEDAPSYPALQIERLNSF